MNDSSWLPTLLIILAVAVFVFLLFREFFCWYWKINKGLALLDELVEFQDKLVDIQTKTNEKLEQVCEELVMLRQQQLELSIKQQATQQLSGDA